MSGDSNGYREALHLEDSDIGEFISTAKAQGKEFLEAEKEYLLLRMYEASGRAVGRLSSNLLGVMFGLLFLLFASVALALWLGTLVGNAALGFLITGGIYLLAFLVVHFFARKAIRGAIMLNVINSFYEDED